ncbi:EAL domain-containing protein [Hydrogenivirga caldilitoris]|uniref:EAL domain-containing protein n=1 Tax=Hydrogenivirga caldilitoris TaxID=246264 RepID=UPI001FE32B94|nr:EAL domain-containing protein [Hydrogenivirga caldilitoris]
MVLVDDNPDDRFLVERELRKTFEDIEVVHVKESKELRDVLERGDFDLLITDYQLRWTDGLSVLRKVKEKYPLKPVIMFTGTGNEEVAVEAMKSGLDDYVLKSPKHFKRLAVAAKAVLEKAQQREELERIEATYRDLFNNVPIGLFRLSRDGEILDLNPIARELFGVKLGQKVSIGELFLDRKELFRFLRKLYQKGLIKGYETRLRTLKGDVLWVKINVRKIEENGKVFYEGSVEDITKQKLAEEKINKVLGAYPDLVFLIKDGKFTYVKGSEDDLLTEPDKLVSKSIERVVPPGVAIRWRELINEALDTGSRVDYSYTVHHPKKGVLFYQAVILPFSDGEVIIFSRNVTQEVSLNRMYRTLSSFNRSLLYVRSEEEMFMEMTRILVEEGGFRLAMVCRVEDGEFRLEVAHSDRELSLDPPILSRVAPNLLKETVRSRSIRAFNNVYEDFSGELRDILVKEGFLSCSFLPLEVEGEVFALLVLFSDMLEFFRGEELELLEELRKSAGYALESLRKEERLHYLTYHDQLTGLLNRTAFMEVLRDTLEKAKRENLSVALLIADVAQLRYINESHGHTFGDRVLVELADRLRDVLRTGDVLARLGADEFGIVLTGFKTLGDIEQVIGRILTTCSRPINIKGVNLTPRLNVGIALFPDDAEEMDELVKKADIALNLAKEKEREFYLYSKEVAKQFEVGLIVREQLPSAIEKGQLYLLYQPIVSTRDVRVRELEALVRWNHPELGNIPPSLFISVAERTGDIVRLGEWILRKAVRECSELIKRNPVGISINLSAKQLKEDEFLEIIEAVVSEYGIPTGRIQFEITERELVEATAENINILVKLKDKGFSIAIDDFGTGYSSLSYLTKFPIDTLKIDMEIIRSMEENLRNVDLVAAIIEMAHTLGMDVIAEGVETEKEFQTLRLLRCDFVQGYYFSPPAKLEELRAMLSL